ncbi:preprotein translocase subunit SecF [Allopseudospirillum japonicum]|uniref:Protein-export membrane protein SecF n=1 Tax=Allopseudospirillum japonicum TaxID=64971 RepID=A0A1H6SS71_9GAMM|nr:protein translocase subunit SecF [Allopseudospirillum japonicum]SEI67647.1 preprotein translocase subunit SecF [Allopseudospirillum japonicum]
MSHLLKTHLDFMGKRTLALIASAVLLVISIGSLAIQGMQFGLDFTGGTLVELRYESAPELAQIREQLEQAGYADVTVQNFGTATDILVRLQQGFSPDVGDEVRSLLQAQQAYPIELVRSAFVGSQVGEELREQGGLGMLLALGVVMLYVAFRFQYKFAVGAVLALIHDVLILLGIFSLFQLEFDLTVLAAVLAVIGYSLNDTIVVYDRIRENFRMLRIEDAAEIANLSLNQTLSRTLVTSLTTLLVLLALFFVGGDLIHNFALALIIGISVGTYSSVYIAGSALLALKLTRQDLIVPIQGEVEDDRP